jgi:hypothetical protein
MDFITSQTRKNPVSRRGIYWLASYPRSGNDLLRTFIAHVLDLIRGDEPLAEVSPESLLKYTGVERMEFHFRPFVTWKEAVENPRKVFQVRPNAQQKLAADNPHSIFVKTHSAAVMAGGIPQINPSVTRGAVYIVRNPLDVACSFAPYYGVTTDAAIERMGARDSFLNSVSNLVAEFISSWSIHVQSWTETSQMDPFILRYEDMVQEPVRAFTAFARHAAMNASGKQIEQAVERMVIDTSEIGQWKQKLTPEQVNKITSAHGQWMAKFGYKPGAGGNGVGTDAITEADAAGSA